MAAKYFLQLEQFEGPLDLLLHLIKVNEIDVFDIDIYLLTSQYLAYLRLIKFDDLGDAGEFLEMAAHLIEIKSKMLLPHDKAEEELDEDDPRVPLQQRLQEYELFKAAGQYLAARPQLGVHVYGNKEAARLEPMFDHIESPLTGEPATLVILYEQMLRNMTLRRKPAKVTLKSHHVTIEQVLDQLEKKLEDLHFMSLQSMFPKFRSRYELVVNIMATLEMAKTGKLKIYQRELLGPVWMYRQSSKVKLVSLEPELDDALPEDMVPMLDIQKRTEETPS